MSSIRVSVVIPTYNRAAYVADAVRSVLAQTCREIEVIVIDDGSTDNTAEVLAPFGEQIRYVRQANTDRAIARNHGVKLARGEFIAFLDSDDMWLPTKLERQLEIFSRWPEVGLVGCAFNFVDVEGRLLRPCVVRGYDGRIADGLLTLLRVNLFGSTSVVMMRRSLFESLGGFNADRRLLLVEDYELWCRAAGHAPVYYQPEPLVNFREHRGNFPRPPMRLLYGYMARSLLQAVPLSGPQRRRAGQTIGQRLFDNAWESWQERQFALATRCLLAAPAFWRGLIVRPAFYKLLTRCLLHV